VAASAALRAAGLTRNAPCKITQIASVNMSRAAAHPSRTQERHVPDQPCSYAALAHTVPLGRPRLCFRPFHHQIRHPRPHPRQAPSGATRQTQPGYRLRLWRGHRGQRPRVGGAGAPFSAICAFFSRSRLPCQSPSRWIYQATI
jgi:hypothetical protein